MLGSVIYDVLCAGEHIIVNVTEVIKVVLGCSAPVSTPMRELLKQLIN